ncbi:MAG: trehalose-6-phosphate synthase [Oligoflexia bacterium]|nr:trehalose-6-phosphate synthase [Oligoflexia bacterium]
MRRFYLIWIYVILLVAAAAAFAQSYIERRHLLAEEHSKTATLVASLEESIETAISEHQLGRLARTARRLERTPRLIGFGVCVYDLKNNLFYPRESRGYPNTFALAPLCQKRPPANSKIDYAFHPVDTSDIRGINRKYLLVVARDLSYLRKVWIESFLRAFLLILLFGSAILVVVTSQMRRWLKSHLRLFHTSLRSLIAGRRPNHLHEVNGSDSFSGTFRDLRPISEDIDKLAKILSMRPSPNARSATERWLPTSLSRTIAQKSLVVVANREPYIHQRAPDGSIQVMRPASGLVTALEPILRQCGGLWIAHGSGSADYAVTNEKDEIAVPPEKPTYTLKRVRLSPQQEEGYYYGFSNEGLWPLCHLAHTRPIFRLSDWQRYIEVNQLFADSIPENLIHSDTLFLVQDYHFGLLPKILKSRGTPSNRPKIGIFWHIPWPNPEAFGICPWAQQLLSGMLGADIIGFHTQFHCNNFLESCNRYLEARIDYEHFSVTMDGHETRVRAFPIGIDTAPVKALTDPEREQLKAQYGIKAQYVAVGVDRIDYTKGLLERVEAVERFLEKHPEYIGRFTLAQMGSPSRTHISTYQRLNDDLVRLVDRVNARYSQPNGYKPIVFIPTHHEWKEIQYFYQLGDLCLVTSLHDGMNLVAKEYVWCQSPEKGALILSKFTGASRELTQAFIINPYSIEEMADAIFNALLMSPEEKAARMTLMRETVHSHNAYRWASEVIEALLSREAPETATALGIPGLRTRLGASHAFRSTKTSGKKEGNGSEPGPTENQ